MILSKSIQIFYEKIGAISVVHEKFQTIFFFAAPHGQNRLINNNGARRDKTRVFCLYEGVKVSWATVVTPERVSLLGF